MLQLGDFASELTTADRDTDLYLQARHTRQQTLAAMTPWAVHGAHHFVLATAIGMGPGLTVGALRNARRADMLATLGQVAGDTVADRLIAVNTGVHGTRSATGGLFGGRVLQQSLGVRADRQRSGSSMGLPVSL
ncbi:hypothetical protein ACFW93_45905 [Streptomyces canus]|uniref:hypothetical protein n=1 Tax=Streptomyces canus TaxID=58343 RepID=UPI0036CD3FA9